MGPVTNEIQKRLGSDSLPGRNIKGALQLLPLLVVAVSLIAWLVRLEARVDALPTAQQVRTVATEHASAASALITAQQSGVARAIEQRLSSIESGLAEIKADVRDVLRARRQVPR